MIPTGPIFVGGTGRSGTTIVAQILDAHPRMHMIPIEVRFIVDPGGLCDLVAGRTDLESFESQMVGPWWQRMRPDGDSRGLHKIIERDSLDEALDRLSRASRDQLLESSREFVHQILDPLADAAGAETWVEMTPPNVAHGDELLRLFPTMKLVHSVRNGKDVACSVTPLGWGPDDPISALTWWGDRMKDAQLASAFLGSANLLAIRLEDLIVHDREETLCRLLEFSGLEPDRAVDRFFRREVTIGDSNIGRWAADIPADSRDDFLNRYDSIVTDLGRIGVDV